MKDMFDGTELQINQLISRYDINRFQLKSVLDGINSREKRHKNNMKCEFDEFIRVVPNVLSTVKAVQRFSIE